MTPGYAAWKLAFEISPIILTNGIAGAIPGAMMPVILLTEALNFTIGMLGGGNVDLNSFFAHYAPLPGSSLIDQDIGRYPFANQSVAANAVIAQPLQISMQMIVPVRNELAYFQKLPTIMALRETYAEHNSRGGTYTVVTPSYVYTNCVMRAMRDTSTSATKQPQNTWQLDFERPLITLAQAEQAQNTLMSKLTSGLAVVGDLGSVAWSGLSNAVGVPASLVTSAVTPAAVTALGAATPAASSITVAPLPPL